MAQTTLKTGVNIPGLRYSDMILNVGVVGIVLLMLVPLPRILLDLLLVFSIGFALIILFVSMQTLRPIEFSVFPSILLLATLFRLALNVAATRLILMHGHEGHDAAGQVIKSIGEFVIGGNYTVGIVIFTILVVINFVVITKGAGRIAEVSARFTLDALPGKQMSVDADLNAGLIDDREARDRRESIAREADFYGAMDGASKFVRGDAIAAILIILVNIVGGLVIGVVQQEMGLLAAAQNYTLLTIGEGLVAQIPALIVSTAAGIIVTRVAAEANLGSDIIRQIMVHPQALIGVSGILFLIGLIPGLPHLAFMVLAAGIGFLGYIAYKAQRPVQPPSDVETPEAAPAPERETVERIDPLDLMELSIGYGLIPFVEEAKGGELLGRITAIRKQMALEMGFLVPPVHIRDNLQVRPNEYLILIKGIEAARGELLPGYFLAMNPSGADRGVNGIPTKEPCFGLDAIWVTESEKDRAQMAGYTVVDSLSVLATHLTETIRSYSHELLGRQETQNLLDQFSKQAPKLVEELVPNLLPLGGLVRVLGNLLRERVPIRDLRTILETLADFAPLTKDPEQLTEYVRQSLARTITRQYQGSDQVLPVVALDPALDQQIASGIQQTPQGSFLTLDPLLVQKIVVRVRQAVERVSLKGYQPVILCSPLIRLHIRRMIERFLPSIAVLSSNEVTPQTKLQSLETVRVSDAN